MSDDLSLDLFPEPEPEHVEVEASVDESEKETVGEPKVWSVSQVNRAVRSLLEDSVAPL